MIPHQTAEQIAAWVFEEIEAGLLKECDIAERVTAAIQAASNEELNRKRERVANLEAELVEAKRMLLGAAPAIAEHCIAYGNQMLDDAMIEFATKPGSTSALDAAIAEATAKVTEERDALAAAFDGMPVGYPSTAWVCKHAPEIIAARDARIRAEGRKAGLEEAAAHTEESDVPIPIEELQPGQTKRQFSNTVLKHLAIELRKLAAQAGEGSNAD